MPWFLQRILYFILRSGLAWPSGLAHRLPTTNVGRIPFITNSTEFSDMHRDPDNQVAGISMITTIPNEKGSGAVTTVENNDRNHTPPFSVGSDRFMALQPSKMINCKLSCSSLLTILYQSFHTKYRGPPSYVTMVPLDRNSHITGIWLRQLLKLIGLWMMCSVIIF